MPLLGHCIGGKRSPQTEILYRTSCMYVSYAKCKWQWKYEKLLRQLEQKGW